jgi:hypothetical protein
MDREANTIKRAKVNIIKVFFVKINSPNRAISIGINGMKYLRVANTMMKDGNEKNKAVFGLANPFLR